jgi:carbon storage regulator
MLVLSRLRDETIMIGDDIQITVVDIRGDKVRLGISAPTRIAVHRKEVYESIKAENARAAAVAGSDPDVLRQTFTLGPPRSRSAVSTRLSGLAHAARIRAPDLPAPAPARIGAAAS